MKEFKITSNLIDSQTIGEKSGIGAQSVFEGIVRDNNDGHNVKKLEYECYELITLVLKFFNIMSIIVICLLYTSPSPRDLSTSRMPSSA